MNVGVLVPPRRASKTLSPGVRCVGRPAIRRAMLDVLRWIPAPRLGLLLLVCALRCRTGRGRCAPMGRRLSVVVAFTQSSKLIVELLPRRCGAVLTARLDRRSELQQEGLEGADDRAGKEEGALHRSSCILSVSKTAD